MTQEFLNQSIHYLNLNLPRIQQCLERLSKEEVWQRPTMPLLIALAILFCTFAVTSHSTSSLAWVAHLTAERVRQSLVQQVAWTSSPCSTT